jgi:hypothetical protein
MNCLFITAPWIELPGVPPANTVKKRGSVASSKEMSRSAAMLPETSIYCNQFIFTLDDADLYSTTLQTNSFSNFTPFQAESQPKECNKARRKFTRFLCTAARRSL